MNTSFRDGFEKVAGKRALMLGGGLLAGAGAWKLWGKDKVQKQVDSIKKRQSARHKRLLSIRE